MAAPCRAVVVLLSLVEHKLSQIAWPAEGRNENLLELGFCNGSCAEITVCALLTDLIDECFLVRLTLLQVDANLCGLIRIVLQHFKALIDAYV